jgi:uncharacterized protein YeaO (DUF488 family)
MVTSRPLRTFPSSSVCWTAAAAGRDTRATASNTIPFIRTRKWYSHDPERFEEFGRRYRKELKDAERAQALNHLRELAESGTLTLLTATKHAEISEAAVLADLITG